MGIFELLPPCTWTVPGPGGGTVIIPGIIEIRDSLGRRLGERNRWKRRGAKIDDGGPKAERWTIRAEWYNESLEDNVPAANYPDELNRFQLMFDVGTTGTLVLPTVGPRRCKIESIERVESHDDRDFAATDCVFVEDNEDTAATATISAPSAAASLGANGMMAGYGLNQIGAGSLAPSGSVMGGASELSSTAFAPSDAASDLAAQADILIGTCIAIEKLSSGSANDPSAIFSSPISARARRDLRRVMDGAYGVKRERAGTGVRLIERSWPQPVSLPSIAALYGITLAKILQLNPGLAADPFHVPAGTPIILPATSSQGVQAGSGPLLLLG